jgi:hypothetical protein
MKQVGLGFPSFASKLAEERQRVVHVASSRSLRGIYVKDGQIDGVGCGTVEVGLNVILGYYAKTKYSSYA